MATAPRPGSTRHAKDQVIRITVRGEEALVRPAGFGARDGAMVRRETKAALGERKSLLGALQEMDEQSMDLDSICLLWWLARRKAGDTTMSYGEALDRFPSYAEADELIVFEEILDDEDEDGSPET